MNLLYNCRTKLHKIFDANSDYTTIIITGSGTAANEALLCSYGSKKKILFLSNGEFGNRLIEIARCYNLNHDVIDFGWTNPFDLEKIEKHISCGDFDALMMVHHETSTGMLNPIYELGMMLKNYHIDFLVDAVSSICAEKFSVEKANITFCTASANKALASLPGLAFICGKINSFQELGKKSIGSYYLNLYRHFECQYFSNQTPNTPAISLFFALDLALDELLTETLDTRRQHFQNLSQIIRKKSKALNLSFVIKESQMSRVLTTVLYPIDLDIKKFHKFIKHHNYIIYRGKSFLFERAFQIANIGHLVEEQIFAFLNILEIALLKCKISYPPLRTSLITGPISTFSSYDLYHRGVHSPEL